MPQIHIHTYEEHTDEQRRNLVRDLTATVSDAAAVKPHNVQIMFIRLNQNERAICGRLLCDIADPSTLSDQETPWLLVQMQLFEGRSLDQKRRLSKEMTADIVRHFEVKPDRVQIIFQDMSRMNNATGGQLACDK